MNANVLSYSTSCATASTALISADTPDHLPYGKIVNKSTRAVNTQGHL